MVIKNCLKSKTFLHGVIILLVVGIVSYAAENYGECHLQDIVHWVESSGNLAPVIFIVVNMVALCIVFPQTLFTVVAGLLFGTFKGAILSLIGMGAGSAIVFFLGRYVFRKRILRRFHSNSYFLDLEMLSKEHPLKILALSRIVPVVPYSLANYLWSVTGVRFLPYLIMSVLCLIPETIFLTAGGHLLQSGVTKGTVSYELVGVLVGAGAVIFLLIKAIRKSLSRPC
ncbi:MAG: peptidase [Desulfovibrio sp. S3730MH75]|nr:MAG: peptidase [Desulfovibrio sp. S3730MH75]